MSMRLVVGTATDVGKVRDHNEDGYLVDGDLRLVAVADGMGGHRGGEVASATALSVMHEVFTEGRDLQAAVVAANEAVFERSTEDDDVRGMGTTMTAGVLAEDGETLVIAHVGDSRAYLYRDGELSRVTTDHSLVEELIRAGELTEEEALRDSRRSMITRAVGLEPDVEVDLYPVALQLGDRLVLCSDGLTDMVTDDGIAAAVAAESDPEKAALRLIDEANDAGGVDNITAVLVDVVSIADDEVLEAVPVDVDEQDLDEPEPPLEEDDAEPLDDPPKKRKRRLGIFRR
jgi:serine/threonine protein phosphatase PrpC